MKKELRVFLTILTIIFIFLSLWITVDFIYAIFNNSNTNALSTFKTISLPDILMGSLIVIILGFFLYFLKELFTTLYNLFPTNFKKRFYNLPKVDFPIIATFLIMTFLLISLTTDQFNLITAIIATAVLFQSLLDKNQDQNKEKEKHSTNLTINIVIKQTDNNKKQSSIKNLQEEL